MSHSVRLTPLAINDLLELRRWIACEADAATAHLYIGRIETAVQSLANFPNRGTPRNDLAPNVRTISFERRVVIAYRIDGSVVRVLRIVNGGREVARLFDG